MQNETDSSLNVTEERWSGVVFQLRYVPLMLQLAKPWDLKIKKSKPFRKSIYYLSILNSFSSKMLKISRLESTKKKLHYFNILISDHLWFQKWIGILRNGTIWLKNAWKRNFHENIQWRCFYWNKSKCISCRHADRTVDL